MEVIIKGRHVEITDALRRYAEDKVSRVTRFLDPAKITKIEIELIVDKNRSVANSQTAEVTIHTKGFLVRGKVSSENMYASIDEVVDKLERQIKKHKGKIYDSHRMSGGLGETALKAVEESTVSSERPRVVKTKRIMLDTMSVEEAALQMELLGHDFFVFTNADTGGISVVYKRRDDNYGLIEPLAGKG